jgi:hypothetical protein
MVQLEIRPLTRIIRRRSSVERLPRDLMLAIIRDRVAALTVSKSLIHPARAAPPTPGTPRAVPS